MKQTKPNQKTFTDIILQDSKKIPSFIDGKKEDHRQAFLAIQSVYDNIGFMAMEAFLSKHCITTCKWEVEGYLATIIDPTLFLKVCNYLVKKIIGYQKLAVELECYEAAANFREFLSYQS